MYSKHEFKEIKIYCLFFLSFLKPLYIFPCHYNIINGINIFFKKTGWKMILQYDSTRILASSFKDNTQGTDLIQV